MDPKDKVDRKRAAADLLLVRRRRAGSLRNRTVAIGLVTFALLWGVVFFQLVSGNDPVLARSSPAGTGQSVSSTGATARAPRSNSAEEGTVSQEPEAVVTRQS
jgi:hypothetical protein